MAIKKKKAAIEVQFNWIFILIIGAIILLFFFGIVKTQKKVSETKISSTLRRDIRAIFTGAGVSTGTTSLVELPKVKIDYDCEGYSIQGTNPIKPAVSFSPDSINDIKLVLWALDWNIGYRVTNFLYITSPNIRYVLVYKQGDQNQFKFIDMLNQTLPSEYIEEDEEKKILINKEKIILTDDNENNLIDLKGKMFQDKNSYKVRFVFFGQEPSEADIIVLKGMKDEDVTAIRIDPDLIVCGQHLDCVGKVTYYKKNNDMFQDAIGSSDYINSPSLVGAVFSDLETYNCNMQNAFERLHLITQIYINKAGVLKQHYTDTLNYPCVTVINEIENTLDAIYQSSDSFTQSNVASVYDNIDKLNDLNDRSIKLSCAEIY